MPVQAAPLLHLSLNKLFKLLVCKAGVFNDSFNGIWIKSFVIWNDYVAGSIGHSDVLAL